MSRYDVDFKRFAIMILPTFMRKPLIGAYCRMIISPVVRLHGEFMRWKEETDYQQEHNGQVCKMRGLLNYKLDPRAHSITIKDYEWHENNAVIYQREQRRGRRLAIRSRNMALVIGCRGYSGVKELDFVVRAPTSVDEQRLRALVGVKKLAGKRYEIQWFRPTNPKRE